VTSVEFFFAQVGATRCRLVQVEVPVEPVVFGGIIEELIDLAADFAG